MIYCFKCTAHAVPRCQRHRPPIVRQPPATKTSNTNHKSEHHRNQDHPPPTYYPHTTHRETAHRQRHTTAARTRRRQHTGPLDRTHANAHQRHHPPPQGTTPPRRTRPQGRGVPRAAAPAWVRSTGYNTVVRGNFF